MALSDSARRKALQLSANAVTVLQRRYLVKDDAGRPVEDPADLFWRVARTIAAPDLTYGASEGAVEAVAEEFYRLMAERKWMPNSPTLMNAGRPPICRCSGRMSGVLGQALGRKYSRPGPRESSVKYSVISCFVLRHVK